jgi:hypothetical protein
MEVAQRRASARLIPVLCQQFFYLGATNQPNPICFPPAGKLSGPLGRLPPRRLVVTIDQKVLRN